MSADQYLKKILIRETVDTGPQSRVLSVITVLSPLIQDWAGSYFLAAQPSGSFAKGTANKSGTDLDIFISLSPHNPLTLENIYKCLFQFLKNEGCQPKQQNVSININMLGYSVDLVPGQKQNIYNSDHSLWRRKANTWTKTNVDSHIQYVRSGNRIDETRILKLWRDQNSLDFPSFYLEMTIIEALRGYSGTLGQNVYRVFQYLQTSFESARFVDPANSNNVISDDLTAADKRKIKSATGCSLSKKRLVDIVK